MRFRNRPIFQTAMVAVLLLFSLFMAATVQAQSPGGVSANLDLWLKADAGVTESGGVVSGWTDQSANGTVASPPTPGESPTYVLEAMNFNPALNFANPTINTADQYLTFDPANLPGGTDDRTFIVVASYDDAATGTYHFAFGYGGAAATYADITLFGVQESLTSPDTTLYNGNLAADGYFYTDESLPWPNSPTIASGVFSVVAGQNTGYLYQNAAAGVETPHDYLGTTNVGLLHGSIGAHPYITPFPANQYPWNGQIAEIIVYSDALDGANTSRQKIESYLAIKYGITLSNTNYIAADGTVVWDATANAGYNNDIAGVGRDNSSALNQLKSQSVNADATVMMTATALAHSSFIMWGNDDAPLSFTQTGAPSAREIQQRTWRVESSASESVDVCTDTATATELLVDADGDFSSGATVYPLTNGCTGLNVTFNTGDYFTFAREQDAAPGGVSTNLQLWFKADAGVTESGGLVSSWADQSLNANAATAPATDNQPTLVEDVFNFNPALQFTAGSPSDYLELDSLTGLPTGNNPVTMMAVANATSGNGFDYVFSYGTAATLSGQLAILGTNATLNAYNGQFYYGSTIRSGGGAPYDYEENAPIPDFLWSSGSAQLLTPRVLAGVYDNQQGYLYNNATPGSNTPYNFTQPWNIAGGANNSGYIGSNAYGGAGVLNLDAWQGNIAEVIVYSDALDGTPNTSRQKIESYLAIKYGITLDSTNYVASDDSVVWDTTTNAGYNNDIAGLARDDASALAQLQSQSVNADSTIMMTTTAFASDLSYLVWGNNDGAVAFSATGAPTGLEILVRTWRVQSNASQTVDVCTDVPGATQLVVDSDTDFSSGATTYALTNGCTGLTVTFNDGDYFTIAKGEGPDLPYNQDGIGFSGVITSNPLSGNLISTNYLNWPADLNQNIFAFTGSVFDGENMWLIPYNADQVIKVAPDGSMTSYDDWPAGYVKTLAAFEGGVFDGQNIWLVPHLADQLIKIDKDTGQMTSYSDWPAEVDLWFRSFVGGVYDGTYIWLIPFTGSHLVRVNPTDGSMTAYGNWPAGYTKGAWSFRGGVFDGENIWMIPFYSTHLIKFNTLTEQMTGYNNWPSGYLKFGADFSGGVYDGEDVWMIPYFGNQVVKFDTSEETMVGYDNWPGGFVKGLASFYGGGFDGQNVWMTPSTAPYPVSIDKDTGVMTGHNVWADGYAKNLTLHRYYGGGFDGDNMWLVPLFSDRLVKIHRPAPPAPIVLQPAYGSVTGDSPLTFVGTAQPGTTVEVLDDQGNVLCTAPVDTNGDWTCDVTGLTPGDYNFDVVAIDDYGNESDPTPVTVTYDTTNPPLAVTAPTTGTHLATDPPTFSGTTDPGLTVTVTDGGGNTLCTAVADGSGNWSCTPASALGEGEHNITATVDDGGNISEVDVSFTVDTTAPSAPNVMHPADGSTVGATPTFTGTAPGEAGGTITVYDPDNNPICTTIVQPDGTWSCSLNPDNALPDGGPQAVTVTVTDQAGNEGPPTTVNVTVDTTPPAGPEFTAPISGTTTSPSPTFEGTGEPGATVTVYGTAGEPVCTAVVQGDGTWACSATDEFVPGEQVFYATQIDEAGNESTPPADVHFNVDPTFVDLGFCPGGVCTPSLWLRANDATGSGTITAWNDILGINTFTITGTPQLQSEALNFNNVVNFDGDGDYLIGDTDITFVEAFAVAQTTVDGGRLLAGDGDSPGGSCGAYFFMRDGNHGILIGDEGPDYAFINQTPYFDDYRILNAALLGGTAGSDSHMAVNGAAYATQSYSGGAIDPFTRTPVVAICGNREVNSQFTGDIAEIIVYANELSATDRLKVDSYLALKYGVTLSNTLNYLLSDETVVWSATANADYYHNVAGIVIDSASALTQTKSRSVYSGSLVTMESTALSDGQALVWGHNNLSTAFDQSAGIYSATARIWQVADTGSVGDVTVMVPDTFTATVLLVSDSTDFSSASSYTLTDDGNGNLTASLDFTDGQYFAFGIVGDLTNDSDGDGIPDVDEDLDGDGNPGNDDSDGDGTPDYLDPDDDGDGTPTTDEDANNNGDPTDDDQDGDGIPDYLEPDNGDTDGDGDNDVNDPDDDGDGIPTADECPAGVPCPDTDGDGTPDYLDNDDDGDGIPTAEECPAGLPCTDTDEDGTPDYLDPDDDGDGVPTVDECPNVSPCPDTDGNGTPDYLDPDDDGDGTPTTDEDANNNGDPTDDDQDGDGIPDYLEPDNGDTDGDSNNDVNDPDDDGDGIPTADECPDGIPCPDTDGDGIPDYLDDDDDNDGIPTAEECPAGPPCPDDNNNGIPDYLDVPDTSAPVVTAPVTGTVVATNTPTFEGTGEPGATISITDGDNNEICTTTVDTNGDWTCTPTNPLPEGEQTFNVTQSVGGSASLPTLVTFTVDTTSDVLDISLVPAPPLTATLGVTYTASFSIAGIPSGDTYTATLTEPDWLTLIDNGDGTFTLQGEPTMSGTFTVTVAVETSSGLTDTVSYQIEVDDGIFYANIRFEGSYVRSALGITFTLAVFNDGPEAADGSQLDVAQIINLIDLEWACTQTSGGAACPTDLGGVGTLNQTIPTFPAGSAVTFTVSSQLRNFLLGAQIEVGVIPGPDVVNLNPNQTFTVGDFVLILPVVFKNSTGSIAP